ncbi:MAG: hypothetical protein H6779_02150 [Candidatus Nomurabacteria bacterium]|nr:hypothetical protein [Candidatus Nomurabacteria bacterium]USN88227.1 MAG: hypothetical protein H6779_02150 [Candidatus Nomurabacteria bacterium]
MDDRDGPSETELANADPRLVGTRVTCQEYVDPEDKICNPYYLNGHIHNVDDEKKAVNEDSD